MKGYNDYMYVTKRYLKSQKQLMATMDNLLQRAKELEEEASCIGAPIAKYEAAAGGGCGGSMVESMADERQRVQEKINKLRTEASQIQRLLDKLGRAVMALPADDRLLLESIYIHDMTIYEAAKQQYLSVSWAKQKLAKDVRSVAIMLFGADAAPLSGEDFVFIR